MYWFTGLLGVLMVITALLTCAKIGFACIKPANGSPLEWRLWADRQSPAAYRLERRADAALFGYTVAARVA